MLTDPASFDGDARDAFTVVAPSMPGHGFSFKPNQRRFSIVEISDTFAKLMMDVLGYKTFGSQGGDWGAFVSSRLAYAYPQNVRGIKISLLAIPRERPAGDTSTPEEDKYFDQLANWLSEETGYIQIMGTKPQTLAYALSNSPVGLAAWILEKFHSWTDCDGDADAWLGRDVLATNIMLYWATGAIGSSFWPYYARLHGPWMVPAGDRIQVALRLRGVSEGIPAAATVARRAHVWEHYPLDEDGSGRTFSRPGAARGVSEGSSGIFPNRPLITHSDCAGPDFTIQGGNLLALLHAKPAALCSALAKLSTYIFRLGRHVRPCSYALRSILSNSALEVPVSPPWSACSRETRVSGQALVG